jgi:hypothetical protein
LTLLETSLAWVIGSLLLAGIVARGARRRARPAALPEQAALPFLLPLLTELARTGHARRSDETLERLAARVPDPVPAGLLGRYAAFRYGGQGDGEALARDVVTCAAASRKASRRWRGRRLAKR